MIRSWRNDFVHILLTPQFASRLVACLIVCFGLHSQSETMDVGVQFINAADNANLEPEPIRKNNDENIYLEDVEAQVKETQDEIAQLERDVQDTSKKIRSVRARNYSSSKNLQKEIISNLEKRRRSDLARIEVLRQRKSIERQILEIQKKRVRIRDQIQKAEDAVHTAKTRLTEKRQDRITYMAQRKAYASKKSKKVKVHFPEDTKSKQKRLADAI